MGGVRAFAFLGLAAALANPAWAQTSISGRLTDGTTGGPGKADRVSLIRVGGAMQQTAFKENVAGSYNFEGLEGEGPYLVQAVYQGAVYNARIPPQRGPATADITVYQATADTAGLKVSEPHLMLIAAPKVLQVMRLYHIVNDQVPPRSVVGQPGAFLFDYPEKEAKLRECSLQAGTMPLRCEPIVAPGGAYTVAFAIKPGTTEIELAYELPYTGSYRYAEKLYQGVDKINVVVIPSTLAVEAPLLSDGGTQEHEGVSFKTLSAGSLAAGTELAVSFSGAGTAQLAEDGEGASEQPRQGQRPNIQVVTPSIMRGGARVAILAGAALTLLIGVWLAPALPPLDKSESGAPRLSPRGEELVAALSALDESFARGSIDEPSYRSRRSALWNDARRELVPRRRQRSG